MKKPEVLAPAGNMEALKAAVLAGCDAVYLGGKFFGARNFAGNFDNDEMVEAISYAHLYGVKVYVTMNTLVYEAEVKTFLKYVDFLYNVLCCLEILNIKFINKNKNRRWDCGYR